jgi:hypothetical protein
MILIHRRRTVDNKCNFRYPDDYSFKGKRGRCFVVVLFCGNIFNLPGSDGKAMLCSYFSAPDLPELVPRLG